ncbi:EpsG family protein [Carboxylicivirga sp. RSCT41]|uniref:EpsG family protein n=1 Tax=Carboxylicivirga agarovorans TaxID=3417570 RepID=UPI003D34CD50
MSLIPLEYYTEVFINAVLIISIIVLVHTSGNTGYEVRSRRFNLAAVFFVFILLLLYMGLRPISGYYFGDMLTYARNFETLTSGGFVREKDLGFSLLFKFSSMIMSVEWFFLLCAFLYILPLYIAVRRWHHDYAFLAFLALIGSFSFWGYGTNGIRAGLASSFFICALSYRKNIPVMIGWLILSLSFHKSMILPILAFALTFIYNKPKTYLLGWFVAIVLSASMGSFWENLFMGLGLSDDRFSNYLSNTENLHQFSRTGFRWDFLLYSSVAVVVGYLYIAKFKFKDKFYHQLYNTYVICNAFWIMVIRVAFSNRFAYLSWFMMALVIVYPLLKHKMFRLQYSKIGYVLFIYIGFTYVMYYLLVAR